MRELYDQLIAEGEAGIERLIAERMQEGVQLDFKQKVDPTKGSFDDNDKKILAKAVSGFANSAGGLLIWGVKAKKGPDGLDCALSPPAPIVQIEIFQSEATRWVGQYIQPRHDGVHITIIKSAILPGAGYLLMYVERSSRRPHRSEVKDQKQYFKRAGDSFFEMEHYDIEDAFSRTYSPKLELRCYKSGFVPMGDQSWYQLTCEIHNTSDTVAKYPYLLLDNLSYFRSAIYQDKLENVVVKDLIRSVEIYGGSDLVIHPELSIKSHVLELTVFSSSSNFLDGEPSTGRRASFDYRLGCEGARMTRGRVSIPASDMIAASSLRVPMDC